MKKTLLTYTGVLGLLITSSLGAAHAAADSKITESPLNMKAGVPIDFPMDVKFDTGKAVIKNSELTDNEFTRVKNELANRPYSKVEIEGYTDSVGTAEFNQKLSEQRAQAVRQRFIDKLGIAPDRVTAIGFGEKHPAQTNDTVEGRAQNRRVIAHIYRPDPTAK